MYKIAPVFVKTVCWAQSTNPRDPIVNALMEGVGKDAATDEGKIGNYFTKMSGLSSKILRECNACAIFSSIFALPYFRNKDDFYLQSHVNIHQHNDLHEQ